MEAQLPYPDILSKHEPPPMWHIVSPGREKFACGMPIKVSGAPVPRRLSECDCVVCAEIWRTQGPWTI